MSYTFREYRADSLICSVANSDHRHSHIEFELDENARSDGGLERPGNGLFLTASWSYRSVLLTTSSFRLVSFLFDFSRSAEPSLFRPTILATISTLPLTRSLARLIVCAAFPPLFSVSTLAVRSLATSSSHRPRYFPSYSSRCFQARPSLRLDFSRSLDISTYSAPPQSQRHQSHGMPKLTFIASRRYRQHSRR